MKRIAIYAFMGIGAFLAGCSGGVMVDNDPPATQASSTEADGNESPSTQPAQKVQAGNVEIIKQDD